MPNPDRPRAATARRRGRPDRRVPVLRDERSMYVLEILVALTAASAAIALSLVR